jgi:hypothetical protein
MSGYENAQVSKLGGGLPGGRNGVGFSNTLSGSDVALKRKILRKVLKPHNVYYMNNGVKTSIGPSIAGPFRTAFSQGDVLGRNYQTCGGSNQVNDVNSRILRPKMADSINSVNCNTVTNGVTPIQVPLNNANGKYVCDSSLFTKFKQLDAINSNYNDKSFGGDDHNGSYTFLVSARRR